MAIPAAISATAVAVLRFAFKPELEAGFSTIDIGGILSNVANKFLLDGFFSVERTWRNICAVRNVSDFKTVTSYRLIGADEYEQVASGRGTQARHTGPGDLHQQGRYLWLDAFDRSARHHQRRSGCDHHRAAQARPGSGLKINDVFWATFMNNTAFFTAANKNYLTGADTVLGIDGLTAGRGGLHGPLTDSDGKPIGIMPAIMLVPTALSAMGTQLWRSLEIRDTTASTKYPIANPHQGKFRVGGEPLPVEQPLHGQFVEGLVPAGRSERSAGDRGGVPQWPGGRPRSRRPRPTSRSWACRCAGYHDFGVALQDNRGGVKTKGEA